MKTSHRIIAALIGIGAVAGAAQAQGVDQRHYNQQHREDRASRHIYHAKHNGRSW